MVLIACCLMVFVWWSLRVVCCVLSACSLVAVRGVLSVVTFWLLSDGVCSACWLRFVVCCSLLFVVVCC